MVAMHGVLMFKFEDMTVSCLFMQVENEVTVFDGIVAWIEGCEAGRSPDLAFLMGEDTA
jgi:hypothetical protein